LADDVTDQQVSLDDAGQQMIIVDVFEYHDFSDLVKFPMFTFLEHGQSILQLVGGADLVPR
jgi:hypothetical protein